MDISCLCELSSLKISFHFFGFPFGSYFNMKGIIGAFACLIVALTIAEVMGQSLHESAEVAHHRSKRSPYEPISSSLVGPLILGKSFLLGSLLGPKIFRGPGWGPPRRPGWGWGGPSYSSGGWGGWSSPVVTVTRGWGW